MKVKSKSTGGYTRRNYYEEMCRDEGDYCKACRKSPPEVYLEIHHKDRDTKNNARSNRQFLCRSCNRMKDPRGKAKRKTEGVSQAMLDEPRPQTAEMKKSKESEPVFLQWLYEQVRKHGRIPVDEDFEDGRELPSAVYGGASSSNASPVTTRRWLRKACARTGNPRKDIFVLRKDDTLACLCVYFRDSKDTGIHAGLIKEHK